MPNSRAEVYSFQVVFGKGSKESKGSRGDPWVPTDICVTGESKVNSKSSGITEANICYTKPLGSIFFLHGKYLEQLPFIRI